MSNAVKPAAFDAALKYRPDIDGLRAIAILAVVLFHFELGLPGGYVGVDVFFVISGYLITKLILADLEQNRFSMLAFWERRVRRLMPAMFVMIGTVLVAGYFLLLPEAYKELAESVVWQMFFLSNAYFWLTTGYFAGPAEEKPLLHTWSLSVEEQFYLLVPLLMLACWRYGRDRAGVVRMCIAVIAVGSFLVSVYTVAHHRSVAFYLLPSRAWDCWRAQVGRFQPMRPPDLPTPFCLRRARKVTSAQEASMCASPPLRRWQPILRSLEP